MGSDTLNGAVATTRRQGVSFAASLAFENISHRYHSKDTIKNVSLTAEAGEVLCLLGPSGSGKTTLLRIAAGIEMQTGGRLLLNGQEISGPSVFLPPERRGVGLMFQDFALFPHMTIRDNVCFGLNDLPKKEALMQADAALDRVGLFHYADRYPHVLSGGEQQRVALARALAPRPAVLLMDEPFSGLDSRLKDSIRADTLAILRETRATAIVVTHDAEEAMRMADRIALLKDGCLVQVGTADELYRKPCNLFAAGFFSEINVFDARVRGGRVETPLGGVPAGEYKEGQPLSVAVRLSGVQLEPEGGDIPARILSRRFLGVVELLELAVPQSERTVRARIRADLLPQGLRDVTLSVNERDILVFEKDASTS
ncbi:ABC transporter ATP-binding protein [Sinorhizobium americanum]|uniref:Iron(III) transport system ATP-binding protein n=1 Tax=Sinorhizobium americanum TaxID=194963 RepID=A0A1L3LLH8_9HYPH|nr:ABC transporter ATP-binding protein [Sinorhizobium americanum]APG84411.1 spermidine/putrescine import ATP-binding protein PotA [Sinorhizobium americanum CCGM7]APG90962.1 spermidine/putrescine import ATP-binding protein PotA [Sinorhizobium americanum]OAP43572.1 iron ABC transporter ATP-binding protein [Sinorhizobium americanum]TCN25855.1 iron(III) transport system ATP-binding protein [Sinorhizobium americanum]